jgi:hypothetical protein
MRNKVLSPSKGLRLSSQMVVFSQTITYSLLFFRLCATFSMVSYDSCLAIQDLTILNSRNRFYKTFCFDKTLYNSIIFFTRLEPLKALYQNRKRLEVSSVSVSHLEALTVRQTIPLS